MKKRLLSLAAAPGQQSRPEGPTPRRRGIWPLGVAFTSLALVSGLIGAGPASANPEAPAVLGPTVTTTANTTWAGSTTSGPLTANLASQTTHPASVSPGDPFSVQLTGTFTISSNSLDAILKGRATTCTIMFTVFDVSVTGAVPSPQNFNLAPMTITSNYPPLAWTLPSKSIGPLTAGASGNVTISLVFVRAYLTCHRKGGGTVYSSPITLNQGPPTVLAVINIVPAGNLGTVGGQVSTTSGTPVPGAGITVCDANNGNCYPTVSDNNGAFSISNLAPDQYFARAFPKVSSGLVVGTGGPGTLLAGGFLQVIIIPQPPVPVPPNVALGSNTGSHSHPKVPVEYWKLPFPVSVTGCPGGTATWSVTGINTQTGLSQTVSGNMTEAPAGTYSAVIPPLYPMHGATQITLVIHCPDGTTQTATFSVYIDPSGNIVNQFGKPVKGATATLSAGTSMNGPFTPVANGDTTVMSPANANNPQLTGSTGYYGWDVTAGYYTVTATAPNCNTVTSSALSIPPPVTGLTLTLTCH